MDDVLSRRALNRATLARQMLLQRSDKPVIDAVDHLVGLQAQAPFSPYYQLWSRLHGFTPDDLAQPLLDRRVVRIVVMRGTIHLVSAADALPLRAVAQPIMDRDLRTNATYSAALVGLDLEEFAIVARKLLEAKPLTMAEMGPLLAEQFPSRDPKALAQAARNTMPLVQVPPRAVWGRSGQTRLAPAESWLGRARASAGSMADVALRYFGAFGPASVADLQTWSGLTRLKEVVESLRPRLRAFRDDDGKELFDLPDAPRPDEDVPAPPRFLPDFDNLIRSHADRRRVIDDKTRKLMNTRNGVSPHSVLVDGEVAGTWLISTANGDATLRVTPLRSWSSSDTEQVRTEGERLLAFAEPDATSHIVDVA